MKKAFIFAITALIIAMTATGCGNEAKPDTSKSTADEANYSTNAVAEVTTTTNDQNTTDVEPSGTGATEPTVPTPEKPKTNGSSESSKSSQSSGSQTSDHTPAERSSASGNGSSAQSHSSNQTSAPDQSHSGGQSYSSSSQTSNKEPSVSDPNEGKTWHNAVYKTINHPAETKEVKVVDQEAYSYDEPIYGWRTFCNVCGADITETCQSHMKEHALAGEGGRYHDEYVQVDSKTISVPEKSHTETVVVKEAWTEKILVKEAGWY